SDQAPREHEAGIAGGSSPSPEVSTAVESDGSGDSQVNDAGPRTQLGEATYVYALGRVEPRFPTAAIEKEYAQVAGRGKTVGLTDRQAVQSLLSDRRNLYLARQLCWVFAIQGLETYILYPRDPLEIELLLYALRPEPAPTD